jgi:hypothetical protein
MVAMLMAAMMDVENGQRELERGGTFCIFIIQ